MARRARLRRQAKESVEPASGPAAEEPAGDPARWDPFDEGAESAEPTDYSVDSGDIPVPDEEDEAAAGPWSGAAVEPPPLPAEEPATELDVDLAVDDEPGAADAVASPADVPTEFAVDEPALSPQEAPPPEPVAVHPFRRPEGYVMADRTVTPMPAPDVFAGFGDEMAAIVRHAAESMADFTGRAEREAESLRQAAEEAADDLRRSADQEADLLRRTAADEAVAVRSAAESDAHALRQTATAEADAILQAAKSAREEARLFKQSAKDEANAVMQSAKSSRDEAQRRAAEVVRDAERQASELLANARTRHDQLVAAERELRKRLQGAESLFRSLQGASDVVADAGAEPPPDETG